MSWIAPYCIYSCKYFPPVLPLHSVIVVGVQTFPVGWNISWCLSPMCSSKDFCLNNQFIFSLFLCLSQIQIFLAYRCPVFPMQFVEETVLFPSCIIILIKYWWLMCVASSRALHSVPPVSVCLFAHAASGMLALRLL